MQVKMLLVSQSNCASATDCPYIWSSEVLPKRLLWKKQQLVVECATQPLQPCIIWKYKIRKR